MLRFALYNECSRQIFISIHFTEAFGDLKNSEFFTKDLPESSKAGPSKAKSTFAGLLVNPKQVILFHLPILMHIL